MRKIFLLFLLLIPAINIWPARSFNGTSDYLVATNAVYTTFPFTMCVTFRPTTHQDGYVFIQANTANTSSFGIIQRGVGSVRARICDDASICNSSTSGANSNLNAWNTACAVFATSASRTVYLNGTAATTDTTFNTGGSGWNRTGIGAETSNSTVFQFFLGDIAEAAIYDVSLSQADVTAYHAALNGSPVRQPAAREIISIVGVGPSERGRFGTVFSATGTAAIGHAPVFFAN